MTREKLLLAAGCAALLAAVATGQTPTAPPVRPLAPPYQNLQVLPKGIAQADLVNNMKFFAQSLGVRCSYCHVGVEGQPLSSFDFASDAKVQKQTARAMLKMVHKINVEEFGVKDFKDVKVTCYTCHRGSTKPLTAPPPAPAAAPQLPVPPQKPQAESERGSI